MLDVIIIIIVIIVMIIINNYYHCYYEYRFHHFFFVCYRPVFNILFVFEILSFENHWISMIIFIKKFLNLPNFFL